MKDSLDNNTAPSAPELENGVPENIDSAAQAALLDRVAFTASGRFAFKNRKATALNVPDLTALDNAPSPYAPTNDEETTSFSARESEHPGPWALIAFEPWSGSGRRRQGPATNALFQATVCDQIPPYVENVAILTESSTALCQEIIEMLVEAGIHIIDDGLFSPAANSTRRKPLSDDLLEQMDRVFPDTIGPRAYALLDTSQKDAHASAALWTTMTRLFSCGTTKLRDDTGWFARFARDYSAGALSLPTGFPSPNTVRMGAHRPKSFLGDTGGPWLFPDSTPAAQVLEIRSKLEFLDKAYRAVLASWGFQSNHLGQMFCDELLPLIREDTAFAAAADAFCAAPLTLESVESLRTAVKARSRIPDPVSAEMVSSCRPWFSDAELIPFWSARNAPFHPINRDKQRSEISEHALALEKASRLLPVAADDSWRKVPVILRHLWDANSDNGAQNIATFDLRQEPSTYVVATMNTYEIAYPGGQSQLPEFLPIVLGYLDDVKADALVVFFGDFASLEQDVINALSAAFSEAGIEHVADETGLFPDVPQMRPARTTIPSRRPASRQIRYEVRRDDVSPKVLEGLAPFARLYKRDEPTPRFLSGIQPEFVEAMMPLLTLGAFSIERDVLFCTDEELARSSMPIFAFLDPVQDYFDCSETDERQSLLDVCTCLDRALGESGLSIAGNDLLFSTQGYRKVIETLGIDSALDALAGGVPVELLYPKPQRP